MAQEIEAKITYVCPTTGSTCMIDLKNVNIGTYADDSDVTSVSYVEVHCECENVHYLEYD